MSDIIDASQMPNLRRNTVSSNTGEVFGISFPAVYRPNFVLVGASSGAKRIFTDILPTHGDYHELANVIVTSWESFQSYIFQSNIVISCCLSIILEAINNATYQAYLLSVAAYEYALELPDAYAHVRSQLQELISVFSSQKTRSLWWLGAKIEIFQRLEDALERISGIFQIARKMYLGVIVFACIAILNIGVLQTSSESSFLLKFVDNYSYSDQSQILGVSESALNLSIVNTYREPSIVKKIIEHTVTEGETVAKLASDYSISELSVRINNNIEPDAEVSIDQKLYIPWTDGYIYNVTIDAGQTPQDIADFYKIPVELVTQENEYILSDGLYLKDSLVLIATPESETQLPAIDLINQQESDRLADLDRTAKLAIARRSQLSQKSVSAQGSTYLGQRSDARSEGFIWPANGNISRCVQPGHVACDIANRSAPPIYAVQEGVVATVSYGRVAGYGNMVTIDHGNGIRTLYAHMTEVYVQSGQRVQQGEAIGQMGCTGWCTGTHLHFEVIANGVKKNPLLYLP